MNFNLIYKVFGIILVILSMFSFVSAVSSDNLIIGDVPYGEEVRLYEQRWVSDEILGTFDEFGSIIVEDDILYFGSKKTPGNITAMNVTDGSIKWNTAFSGDLGTDGTPLLDNQGDYLYINTFSSFSSKFYKFYKNNGTEVCNNTFGAVTHQAVDQSDTMIFDTYRNGTIVAYNKDDCSINWTYSQSSDFPNTPLYVYEDDSVVFNTRLGSPRLPVIKLNATNGSLVWNVTPVNDQTWHGWDNKPSYEDNILYMPFGGGAGVIAYYYNNGTEKWVNNDLGKLYTIGTLDSDSFYGGGSGNTMYKLNKTNGSTICSLGMSDDIYNGLLVTNYGVGIVGSIGNDIKLFNTTNCDVLWTASVGGAIYDMMTVAKGNLYFKADDGKIYAFNLGNGTAEYSRLGFDENGTNLCVDCLESDAYVSVLCDGPTEYGNLSCNFTNLNPDYDSVNNFSVSMPYDGILYYSNGTQVNNESSQDITFSSEINYNETLELTFSTSWNYISNCSELQAIDDSSDMIDNYKLVNDIDCSNIDFNTLGRYDNRCFYGTFDGENHIIYNLNHPLFTCLMLNGEFKNTGFVNCTVANNEDEKGIIANIVDRAIVENVFFKGDVHCSGFDRCSGLIGREDHEPDFNNTFALMWNWTFGDIGSYQGGLSGEVINGHIDNSYSAGFVRAGFKDAFYDSDKNTLSKGDGIAKTTAELQTLSTYIDAGWNISNDTSDVWHIDEGRYPCLTWNTEDGECPDFAPTPPSSLGLSSSEFSVGDTITMSGSGSYDLDLDDFDYYYKFYDVNTSSILQDWSITSSYEIQETESEHIITLSAKPVSTLNGSLLSSNVTVVSKQCDISSDYSYTDGGVIDCVVEGLNVSAVLTVVNTTILTDYISLGTSGKIVLDSNSRLVIS